jgi:hypothetical protein
MWANSVWGLAGAGVACLLAALAVTDPIASTWLIRVAALLGIMSVVVLVWPVFYRKQSIIPDYEAREAFRWIYSRSRWALGKEKGDGTNLVQLGEIIRDAARQGQIHVWGRRQENHMILVNYSPTAPIPTDYWDNAAFELLTCFLYEDKASTTVSYKKERCRSLHRFTI